MAQGRPFRMVATALCAAIPLLSVDVRLITGIALRNDSSHASAFRADRIDGYAEFLAGVRARTRNGDAVALIAPVRTWRHYMYLYYRASYLLAGRELVPMMTPHDEPRGDAIRRADYVAIFGVQRPVNNAVWSAHGGSLVKRP